MLFFVAVLFHQQINDNTRHMVLYIFRSYAYLGKVCLMLQLKVDILIIFCGSIRKTYNLDSCMKCTRKGF